MVKSKKVVRSSTVKIGHGIHRARKTNHKDHTRELKHEKKWIEDKIDNK